MSEFFTGLNVGGLRGMSASQRLDFAVPNMKPGSGLTVLVGSNNAGKSTVVEALRVLSTRNPSSFSEGRRNRLFGDEIEILIESGERVVRELRSVRAGGSETRWVTGASEAPKLLVLPSRRGLNAYFSDPGQELRRESYAYDYQVPALKAQIIDAFAGRLFKINRDPESRRDFEALLGRIVNPLPDWTIDQNDMGQYYLKFRWGSNVQSHAHSSDGLGEGLVSLFFIIDSLYDSLPGSMTVIDEPELSLHPQFQKRLRLVMSELAKDRQIVYATHSPYFVSWADIDRGARIARVHKSSIGTQISQPSDELLAKVSRLSKDRHNPHLLGLDASEVFFLEDRVILVEGQEDVVRMPAVLDALNVSLDGSFFGWGVGGAEKMETIAGLLDEMNYESVVGILDNDKTLRRDALASRFPQYKFLCIPADDIRTKPARSVDAKHGLLDERGLIRAEYESESRLIFGEAKSYLEEAINRVSVI